MIRQLISVTVSVALILTGGTSMPLRGEDLALETAASDQLPQEVTGEFKDATADPPYVDQCLPLGCYGCRPVLYAETEALLFRSSRADGMTNNASDPEARFEDSATFVPRLTAGLVLNCGLGARLRYCDIDEAKVNGHGEEFQLRAQIADLELFENIRVTEAAALEWSIGLRHIRFSDAMDPHPLLGSDLRRTQYEGLGLVAGLEVNRSVRWGSIYGRAKGAMLLGDRDLTAPGVGLPNVVQHDVTAGVWEFAAGWEISRTCRRGMVLTAGVGWEVQRWMDHSTAGADAAAVTAPVDVGFSGAVFNLAVGY